MKHRLINILSTLSVRVRPVLETEHYDGTATAFLTTWGRADNSQELGNDRQRLLETLPRAGLDAKSLQQSDGGVQFAVERELSGGR